jgi:D-sedoheptulose 7-phosphate isomerase
MVAELTSREVAAAFARRTPATDALAEDADRIAAACEAMAQRFHAGGRLITFGNGSAAADAAHVDVEFVHPVIVGKQALPAVSLASDAAAFTGIARRWGLEQTFAIPLRALAGPQDIAVGISVDGRCANVVAGLGEAHRMGLLTVALVGGDGGVLAGGSGGPLVDHLLRTPATDPFVVKEMHVTIYHVLWELVHVFFEQPGALAAAPVS